MKKEDKYTGVVKAINENTSIAMRVLVMTGILVMLCLFSVQSVSAVEVTENVKFQTPGTNTTFIMGSDFTFDTIEVHSSELRLNDAVISVCPSAGSIDFTLFSFSTEYRKWTESCSNPDAIADHTMGGLKPNTLYDIKVNGVIYGQYGSNGSGYVFFTYSGGYSDIVFEMEETGAPPKFIAHFMTPEGEPYPFDVIISDGTWREEFKDVTYIETEVPCDTTYTMTYDWQGRLEMYEFAIPLSPGESREIEFYAIDPSAVIERVRPYLIGKEVGTNVNLSWQYTEPELIYHVEGEPAGNVVFVAGWFGAACPLNYYALESYTVDNEPPSVTAVKYTIDMDKSTDRHIEENWEGKIDLKSVVDVFVKYKLLSADKVPVGVREVLHNDAMVYPYSMKLSILNGGTYDPEFLYPQWAALPGSYIIQVYNLPEEHIGLSFPVNISGLDTSYIFDVYSPQKAELETFTFSVAAEHFFAHSSYSNLIHDVDNEILTVDVSTETNYDWWGYFVLPDTVRVAAVRSGMPGAWHDLDELYDYTINSVDGYKIVVVRIAPETKQVILAYKVVEPDLVITEKWLCWPDTCMICYNVTNIGDGTAPACHDTALYVDDVAVAHDHVPVDLAPGESYTGCFNGYEWGYTPPSDEIKVCADNNEAIDELDEDNNCLTNIWTCGDVNGDRTVNVIDVVLIYKRALDPGYPLDLPWAGDVNCDRNINVIDVVLVYKRALDPGYDLNCCCEEVG